MSSPNLTICKQLYDALVDPNHNQKFKIIQIVPHLQEYENEGPLLVHESTIDTLDIGLTKQTYLRLFKEVHTYWHSILAPQYHSIIDYLQNLDNDELWVVYYATLGYLITTHEHNTIVKLHETVLSKILERVSEKKEASQILLRNLDILTCYVNSRLKRINKSSSLWHLIKKMTILVIMSDWKQRSSEYQMIVDRTLKSIDLHFANYYASTFLRWLIRINSIMGGHRELVSPENKVFFEVDNQIFKGILGKARAKLTDCSVWSCLETYFDLHLGVDSISTRAYVLSEYRLLEDQLSEKFHYSIPSGLEDTPSYWDARSDNDILDTISDVLAWLIKIECLVFTPFKSCISPLMKLKQDEKIQEILSQVQRYHTQVESQLSKSASKATPTFFSRTALCSSMDRLFKEGAPSSNVSIS